MNPMDIMKNFQGIADKFQLSQEKMQYIEASGSAGGGMVTIRINGLFTILDISIDPIAVNSQDIPMLEDLIKGAFSDAMTNIKKKLQEEIGNDMPLSMDNIFKLMQQ